VTGEPKTDPYTEVKTPQEYLSIYPSWNFKFGTHEEISIWNP
jgi:hypothetical protein